MYSVYKITNLQNQKCYIGSSIRVYKRWNQHKNEAFNIHSSKYNYPLYQAFRKYGLENFSFEILKDDFDSEQEMQDYEYQMICYFDSYNNGYNQTYSTNQSQLVKENLEKHLSLVRKKCAKVDINQNIIEQYSSYHEAAEKNLGDGDTFASVIRRVCKGEIGSYNNLIFRDLDENNQVISFQIKRPHGKKAVIGIKIDNPEEEIYFESISKASEKLCLDRQSISKCLQGDVRYSCVGGYIWREIDINGDIIENNISIDEKIKEYNENNPVINGERHNITEWCNIYNISRQTWYRRRKQGMSVIDAIITPKRR